MTHTAKITVVANAIITKLKTDADLEAGTLLKAITPNADGSVPQVHSEDIYYGDQDVIPRVPSVCVEPATKDRDLKSSAAPSGVTENNFTIYILVYHAGPSGLVARPQADELGEAIEYLLHQDVWLSNGGARPGSDKVIHGFVTRSETGYTYRSKTLYRSVRMTWQGFTKLLLNTAA